MHSAVEDAASTDTLRDVGMDGVAHLPTFFSSPKARQIMEKSARVGMENLLRTSFSASRLNFLFPILTFCLLTGVRRSVTSDLESRTSVRPCARWGLIRRSVLRGER